MNSGGHAVLPVTHTGYLRKLGQKIKNWKRRFFVIELGRLTYFEKDDGSEEPPYGINMKGAVTLEGYEVEDGPGNNMLRLTHATEKRELTIEAEEGKEDVEFWRSLFESHILFCNENPTLFLQVGATFQEDEAKRAAAALKFRGRDRASSLANMQDTHGGESSTENAGALVSAPEPIQLNPGFVIKSKRVNGQKVFINVCDHPNIPPPTKKRGHKKWPVFVLSPSCKVSVDKHAEECHVLDVCVHPTVMNECQQDTTGEAKEELCMKIMEAVIIREKKEKVEAAIDRTVFSFPRLNKKYKGDTPPSFLIPRNMQQAMKNKTVFTAIDLNDHVQNFNEILEEKDAAQREEDDKSSESKESQESKSPQGGIPRKYIPMIVVRQTGAVIRERPEKSAPRIKTLLQYSIAYCYGRRVNRDGTCWYRVMEGWTTALTDGGQRMLKPACAEKPTSCSITGFNIIETIEKGFLFDKTIKQITFSFQLGYPQEAILYYQRSFEEFNTLNEDLRDENILKHDKIFPNYGNEVLTEKGVDMDALVDLMEDMGQWFQSTVLSSPTTTSPGLRKFLDVRETDCQKMDIDLSAVGGLGGAWPIDYR